MRILAVVDHYASLPDTPAGARCRELSTRLVRRGHIVEVLAVGQPGADPDVGASDGGVTVRHVAMPDVGASDGGVTVRHVAMPGHRATGLGRDGSPTDPTVPRRARPAWTAAPEGSVASLQAWLSTAAHRYDAVVFFDHRAPVTWAGMPACAGRVGTLLHPMAVDGATWSPPISESTLRLPTVHAYLDADEEALVARRLGRRSTGAVIGTGVDFRPAGDGARFRRAAGLGERAYLLLVGSPGVAELRWWDRATRIRAGWPAMVVLGDAPSATSPGRGDLVAVDRANHGALRDALAGALAVVRPSCYDGSWRVLAEARAEGRAAIVNGRWPAAVADAHRTRAAVVYRDAAEFVAAVDLLVEDEDLRRRMGAAGLRHVQLTERWEEVISRYERLLWVAGNHR